ncbi:hypothetical protein [Sphingomonas rosea]|jgi:hypothetical protein
MIPTVPVFVEAAVLALIGYTIGLFIAYLAELHRRRASRGWNEWE